MLNGKTKVYKHPKAATLYLTIPSDVVKDSTFPFREGDMVEVCLTDEFILDEWVVVVRKVSK